MNGTLLTNGSGRNLEEARTVDELIRLRASAYPAQTAVVFSNSEGVSSEYTGKQLDAYAYAAASAYSRLYGLYPRQSDVQPPTVIAVIGISDLEYLITLLAIAKLGHVTMLLSPRLSHGAYKHLLAKTQARLLIVQPAYAEIAQQLKAEIPELSMGRFICQPDYASAIYQCDSRDGNTRMTGDIDLDKEGETPVWILHSSGSTGLPKPVAITNRSAMARYGDNSQHFGLDSLTTLPLFHAHGMSSFFRTIMCGRAIQLWNPELAITTARLVGIAKKRHFQLFSAVPFTIKLLAESAEGIEFLQSFQVVTSGGSPMPETLGDALVKKKVKITSIYGMSETGTLLSSARPEGDNEWNWLRCAEGYGHMLRFEDQGSGLYELVCPREWPAIVVSNHPDGSWHTKDLFMKHHQIDAYKYVGRLDDVVVLENGEKVNPIDVETDVSRSPLVEFCVAFGANQPSLGIAVIPSQSAKNLTKDQILAELWPVIQQSQERLPAYAKFSAAMVLILNAGTPCLKTDKGTIIRGKFVQQYQDQINQLYADGSDNQHKVTLSGHELRDYLRSEARRVLKFDDGFDLSDTQDFMAIGMDSLQATQFRQAIAGHLDLGGYTLGLNAIFDFPTIGGLAKEIERMVSGGPELDMLAMDQEAADSMLKWYSVFGTHAAKPATNNDGHIVLTGASGSLGAHLLSKLAPRTDVTKVYCLIRASSDEEAHKRLLKSLESRGLLKAVSRQALGKVKCLASSLSSPRLGLNKKEFEEIACNASAVYHCAWTVNFNQRLESFEKDGIAGVYHLINLCTKSERPLPARLLFFSSIGAIMRTKEDLIPECLASSLSDAQPNGYSRSKQLAERICMRAATEANIPLGILRVGQIIGDNTNGIWNDSEATPLMIRSADTIGALPALDEELRWLAVDDVAQISVEVGSSSRLEGTVFNIVNPRSFHWTNDLLPLLERSGLKFETVKPAEWLDRLRSSNPDLAVNPPMKLLDYFSRQCESHGSNPARKWATTEAVNASPTFAKAMPPDEKLIATIVSHLRGAWKKSSIA